MLRRILDRSPFMIIFDGKAAATLAGRGLIWVMLVFIGLMVAAWWFSVCRFFLYDHWRPTLIVFLILAAWYGISLAIERVGGHVSSMRAHRNYMDYGDDDGA